MINSNSSNIQITNIKNEETVSYSVILLEGIINNSNTESSVIIEINNKKLEVAKKQNHFKCLVCLNLGKNELKFQYGCEIVHLNINYVPRKTELTVIPLYIICEDHNGKFQAPESEDSSPESACKRITLATNLMQCIVAQKLYDKNMGRRTFHLESDCVIFHSRLNYLTARKLNSKDLWTFLAREIMTSDLASENRKYMAFLSCTWYDGSSFEEKMDSYDDFIGLTEGYVALGGGGLALYGTACLYTWPEILDEVIGRFENQTLVDRRKFMDDSSYRGTIGACFATSLGSALHELCHTFNLGHADSGFMGREFGNVYKFFTVSENNQIFTVDKRDLNCPLPRICNLSDRHIKMNRNNEVDWTENEVVLLSYHRWFNNFSTTGKTVVFQYDSRGKYIKSTAGIRVIEIRNVDEDDIVVKFWTFTQKLLKYSFQIPDDIYSLNFEKILIAEDNIGNILKENLAL